MAKEKEEMTFEEKIKLLEEIVKDEEEEYITQYILDVDENLQNEFETIESEMKIER